MKCNGATLCLHQEKNYRRIDGTRPGEDQTGHHGHVKGVVIIVVEKQSANKAVVASFRA